MASSISQTARKRRAAIGTPADLMAGAVHRTGGDGKPRSREDISAADLEQIKNRQEAEMMEEGGIRRKRKKGAFGY